ncbi:MAG TPA: hypothetical protein DGT23_29515 [Micromonosporaceae bacterium]|nr:hypothetical protein [Micromonosporaceae bacterium]
MLVRWLAAVMIGVLAGPAACTGPAADPVAVPGDSPRPVVLPQVPAGPKEDVPSALDNMRHPGFPPPLIDPGQIRLGGPPPDGIPAIDTPAFLRAIDVNYMGDAEAILVLQINSEVRLYPVQVMTWHEIVNDTVAGIAVAVTYCPLCNSGVAFERKVGSRVLSFGTSGRLFADNFTFEGKTLAGKPAVLRFWAPWCPTCAAEAPDVAQAASKYQGKVAVIGLGRTPAKVPSQPGLRG